MDRLIAPNTVIAGQADTAPSTGTPGFATDGNPASNIPATQWPAYQYNAFQEELIAILAAAGITPDRTNNAQIVGAIQRLILGPTLLADTGAANAYTASNTPALTAATWANGIVQWLEIAHTNTGASTYAPDGLGAIPIYGLNLKPVAGNELFAGGIAALRKETIAGINSGNPIAVLLGCSGGALPISPGTQPAHAIQLQQNSGVVGTTRNLKASLAVAGTSLTVTADEIGIKASLGGQSFLAASFNQTASTTSIGIGGVVGTALAANGFAAVYAAYNPSTGATGLYFKNGNTLQPNVDTSQAGWWGVLTSVWPLNGSTQLVAGYQDDREFTMAAVSLFSVATIAGTPTPISVAAAIPPNARDIKGSMSLLNTLSGAVVGMAISGSTGAIGAQGYQVNTTSTVQTWSTPFSRLKIITAQTVYITSTVSGGTPTFAANCSGYSI